MISRVSDGDKSKSNSLLLLFTALCLRVGGEDDEE